MSLIGRAEAEYDEVFAEGHPGCEECGDPVCLAQTELGRVDDQACICYGRVCPGVKGKDHVFCGDVCRAIAEDGGGVEDGDVECSGCAVHAGGGL